MKPNPLVFIELNEFNRDLLAQCSERFELPAIRSLLALRETKTFSVDTPAGKFLEPWCQWVTVHTGRRSAEHLIKHLGDVPGLKFPQIWESLSRQGISSGVWGVMNGSRGDAEKCRFFVPDPWTYSERAAPAALNYLVDLPRYVVKNRKNIRIGKVLALLLGSARILKNSRVVAAVLLDAPQVAARTFRDGFKEYISFTFFEYLSALEFVRMWKKTRPQASFLFLNTMAHLQHYYWDLGKAENEARFEYSMRFIDRAIRKILDLECEVVLYNALSQDPYNQDPPVTGYRPFDQEYFLRKLGVPHRKVEALMTHDAILFCGSAADAQESRRLLQSLTIAGVPLMQVENYQGDPLRLFYQVQFMSPIALGTQVEFPGGNFDFWSVFRVVGTVTGTHVPAGNLFSSLGIFPDRIENSEVMGHVERYFRGPHAA